MKKIFITLLIVGIFTSATPVHAQSTQTNISNQELKLIILSLQLKIIDLLNQLLILQEESETVSSTKEKTESLQEKKEEELAAIDEEIEMLTKKFERDANLIRASSKPQHIITHEYTALKVKFDADIETLQKRQEDIPRTTDDEEN